MIHKWFGSDPGVFPELSKNSQKMVQKSSKNDLSDKKRHKKRGYRTGILFLKVQN